ncbi:MAG: hypothetical protein IT287_04005, partial [Bdellovibrionaceae bacterium]|nr:hypothetical protein [Pseudobdellovibrionaceae bacterium]
SPSAYVTLHELTLDVPTRIDDVHMVDGGDEVITLTDIDSSESLYLKTGDHSYKKQVVKNASDADAIRLQIKKIADAVLASCSKKDETYRLWLRENVSPAGKADVSAMVPHPRYDNTVQDLRITQEKSSIHISGYRIVVSSNKICTTTVDQRVAATTAWKDAIAAVTITSAELVCARALGASEEDWRIFFPTHPKQLSIYKKSGKVETGYFGCWNSERVDNFGKVDAQLKTFLKTQPPAKCAIID